MALSFPYFYYLFTKQPLGPNHAVQLTPLARPLSWARSTRQSATACYNPTSPNLQALLATQRLWCFTGRPYAHYLAAASCRRPPRSRRPPAAQLTAGDRRLWLPPNPHRLGEYSRSGLPVPGRPRSDWWGENGSCQSPTTMAGAATYG